MNIIEVENLKKSYGKFEAVKGISFNVEEGTLFSFLGPNGAGKSTTIDTLCTLNAFNDGKVTIAGYDLKTQPQMIKYKIGAVFQDSLLDKPLTVRENLMIRSRFYFKSKKEREKAVEWAAECTDLKEFMDRPYGKLSGGQRRRADIARALLNAPKILFLDEPTTGLDPQTRKHVWETIRMLQKNYGMTVFLTTHYMEEAAESDFVVIIDHGEIVAQGTPLELKRQHSYEHLLVKTASDKDEKALVSFLAENKVEWVVKQERMDIKLSNCMDALSMLNRIKQWVEDFEVIHGNMDDVFLNITGKEIRE